MTESAAVLEDPARWIGLLIAVAGAISANPDATSHAWQSFRKWMRRVRGKTRGFLARYIPWLRKNVYIHVNSAMGAASAGTVKVTGRGLVGWGENSTVDEKFQILDDRTRALHMEVGEVQQSLSKTEKELRAALDEAAADLRREASEIRQAVDTLRSEIVHSDARALPVIVAGLVLTGLSPDAESVSLWFGWLVLLGVMAFAGTLGWRIWRDWSPEQEHQSQGR